MTGLDKLKIELGAGSKLTIRRGEAIGTAEYALSSEAPIDARDQLNMSKAVVMALLYVGDCILAHAAQQAESGEAIGMNRRNERSQ